MKPMHQSRNFALHSFSFSVKKINYNDDTGNEWKWNYSFQKVCYLDRSLSTSARECARSWQRTVSARLSSSNKRLEVSNSNWRRWRKDTSALMLRSVSADSRIEATFLSSISFCSTSVKAARRDSTSVIFSRTINLLAKSSFSNWLLTVTDCLTWITKTFSKNIFSHLKLKHFSLLLPFGSFRGLLWLTNIYLNAQFHFLILHFHLYMTGKNKYNLSKKRVCQSKHIPELLGPNFFLLLLDS